MTCIEVITEEGRVCQDHGSLWQPEGCLTALVLKEISEHRQFQFENYGSNRDVPDGTGRDVEWLAPVTAAVADCEANEAPLTAYEIEDLFRKEWDYPKDGTAEEQAEAVKQASWMRMMREEVAEAFAQSDPRWLEAELTQVAALAVSWIEKIRERQMPS